jgi:hypothetical protein
MTLIKRKKVVKEIESKTKTLVISAALVLAMLSGIAYMAYANGETNDASTSTAIDLPWGDISQYYAGNNTFSGPPAFRGRCGHGGGRGPGMMITVSEEFKENVLNITGSDSDVQQLLADGYNVTNVRPIIETVVEGDGSVVTKATSAVVMLEKDTTGYASVWVDLEAAKVTRIEIITRTVIEKT